MDICDHSASHFELDKQHIEATYNHLEVEEWDVCNECGLILADVVLLDSENLSPDTNTRLIEDQVTF